MGLVDLVLTRRLTAGWTIEHNNIVRAVMVLWSLHKTEICEYYRLSAFLVPDDLLVSASHHGRVSRCPVFEYDCQITGEGRGEGHISYPYLMSQSQATMNY